jgi:hypothetical protein
MAKLSEESAKKHYEKLMMYHQDNREPAQKIIDFQYGLDHYILKEITGFNEPYDQFGWLLENQIKNDKFNKSGFIPDTLVKSINILKGWRNVGTHGEPERIDNITYNYLFKTMAETINFFSDIPIPDEIQKILNNQTFVDNKESLKELTINTYEFINKEIFSKVKPNMSLYEVLLIFLKELGIEHNTDISMYPLNIRNELIHMEQDILSIIEEILYSFKEKKSLAKFIKDDFIAFSKDVKNEGIIKGLRTSHQRPAPCLKDLKHLEIILENSYINIDEIKLNFKEKYDKMTEWHYLLDLVLLYKKLLSNK